MENDYFKVSGIMVDRRILTDHYDCDVERYDCGSSCCYRGCLLTPEDIERIDEHLKELIPYLDRSKQKFLRQGGKYYRNCRFDCPEGCDVEPGEWNALKIHMRHPREKICCTTVIDNLCIFIYLDNGIKHCALHSLALRKGWKLESIKPIDCVQYPIALVGKAGVKYLLFQEVKALAHLPCLKDKKGGVPMYQTLKYAIEALLGERFYRELVAAWGYQSLGRLSR